MDFSLLSSECSALDCQRNILVFGYTFQLCVYDLCVCVCVCGGAIGILVLRDLLGFGGDLSFVPCITGFTWN